MAEPTELLVMLRNEIKTKSEQGCDTAAVSQELEQLLSERPEPGKRALGGLLAKVEKLKPRPDFRYVEPVSLAGIKRERPVGIGELDISLSKEGMFDKVYGAWLGRCAGCLLGAPVEGWKKEEIEEALKREGAYPLSGYFPATLRRADGGELPERKHRCLAGNIKGMVRDDDLDYTVIGLVTLEEKGRGFSSRDVAGQWLSRLPYHCVYTAERVAYRNLVNGLRPPRSGAYRNPYREWIGAQIRADIWGYVNPGDPEAAAEFAYRDASVSHVKNGTYGEMFFSAAIAAAFATDDVDQVIHAGLGQIPARSRLAEAVLETLEWSRMDGSWEETFRRVMDKHGHYHPVHTINNAAMVILSLVHGRMDFARTICISVMCGLDTDCTGATAGSIMGAMLGAKALPGEWVEPLEDSLDSIVVGMTRNKISDLARRTVALQE